MLHVQERDGGNWYDLSLSSQHSLLKLFAFYTQLVYLLKVMMIKDDDNNVVMKMSVLIRFVPLRNDIGPIFLFILAKC